MNQPMGAPFLIATPEQLRAIADPFRQRLLQVFSQPRTVKEAARHLEQPVTKLYHHVDQLEQTGLIKLVAKQRRRAVTVRTFQTVAPTFAVTRSAFAKGATQLSSERAALALAAVETMLQRCGKSEGAFRMAPLTARLTRPALEQVEAELFKLIKKLENPAAPSVDLLLLSTEQERQPTDGD